MSWIFEPDDDGWMKNENTTYCGGKSFHPPIVYSARIRGSEVFSTYKSFLDTQRVVQCDCNTEPRSVSLLECYSRINSLSDSRFYSIKLQRPHRQRIFDNMLMALGTSERSLFEIVCVVSYFFLAGPKFSWLPQAFAFCPNNVLFYGLKHYLV